MRKLFLVLLFLSPSLLSASSAVHYVDIAISGSGKPIAGAPVRVCNEPLIQTSPCLPLSTIYSDVNLLIVLKNPFTADVLGNFDFYYDSSSGNKVAVQVSCQAGIPGCGPQGAVNTTRNVCVFCGETMQVNDLFVATQPIFDFVEGVGISLNGSNDPVNNRAKLTINAQVSGLIHNLLSETHPDTVPFTPPNIGDLIRGNLGNSWERFNIGQTGQVLTVIDTGGGLLPDWQFPSEICSDLAQVIDLYVSPTGDDDVGDGTPGNPWQHIQYAIDTGVPGIVCGKYTIHLAQGTYDLTDFSAEGEVHVDGRVFAGGGVGGYNTTIPPGGSFWPWESAWIEIVGDPTPGLEYTDGDGDLIDNYIIDHAGSCDGGAAISASGANLVLRGLSIRNGGYGLLAHSSKVKIAGVSFQANCTDIDVGYNSLIYYDKEDLDTGSWCGDTFCWYAEFRTVHGSSKNWGILLHDNSLMSDETPDDNADIGNGGLNFTCVGDCTINNSDKTPNNLIDKGTRLSVLSLWNSDGSTFHGGSGTTSINHQSTIYINDMLVDNGGDITTCGGPPCRIAFIVENGSILEVGAGGNVNNWNIGFLIDTGSKVLYEPNWVNVSTHTSSGTVSYASID